MPITGISEQQKCTSTRALLVGQNSLLARAVLGIQSEELIFDRISHTADLSAIDFGSYDVVVNMAYSPAYMSEAYNEAVDFDLEVARRVAASPSFYVMLSTRRVYGSGNTFLLKEEFTPEPRDHYGRNKLLSEKAIQSLLGERCTILRIGNVFSYEPGRHTFFGIALQNLRRASQIVLDVSPFVSRDFIYLDDFARLLRRVLVCRPAGLFNLGSGKATELGRIALWIIEGFEAGQLVISSPLERDSFQLDVSKLVAAIGPFDANMDIRRNCINIGRTLRNG